MLVCAASLAGARRGFLLAPVLPEPPCQTHHNSPLQMHFTCGRVNFRSLLTGKQVLLMWQDTAARQSLKCSDRFCIYIYNNCFSLKDLIEAGESELLTFLWYESRRNAV